MSIPITDLSYKPPVTSHRTALIQGDKKWSYNQLHEQVEQIAAHLWADGFRPGDRLLICLENGFELVASLLACFKIGVVVIHTYTDFAPAEYCYMAENTAIKGIITTQILNEKMKQIQQPHQLYFSFPIEKRAPLPQFTLDLDQPISISFTSGTTAKRKGVIHSYRSIMETMEGLLQTFGRAVLERPLLISSLGNNYAVMVYLFPSLWLHGTALLLADNRMETLLKAIEMDRPSFAATYPYYLKQIIQHPQTPKTNFHSLKLFVVGGDVVTPELSRDFRAVTKIPLTQGFGMTEAQFTFVDLSGDPQKIGSIGKPTSGVEAKIINDQDHEMPSGEIGQLILRRKVNMLGYWDLPTETSKALHNGWLYTGDLAMKDRDGFYWFRGRIKNVIKVDSESVSPLEVEEALSRHPAVKEAGVIGIPSTERGEVVKAFVVLRTKVSEKELKVFLADFLAEYKIPVEIVFVDHLPRTLTGKLDRNQLYS